MFSGGKMGGWRNEIDVCNKKWVVGEVKMVGEILSLFEG